MTTISAKIIHDSISPYKSRLTTFEVVLPTWIEAELLRHRIFSFNSASSRAIPFEKMLASVEQDPAVPMFWTGNQPGMSGTDLSDADHTMAKVIWLEDLAQSKSKARHLHSLGYHKQICNRLLHPFMHRKILISSTDYENFFKLRCHPAAEPHMRYLAESMRHEYSISEPITREYHLPYTDDLTCDDYTKHIISVARCASVSYKTVDEVDMSPERALQVFQKLVQSDVLHASPFEHVAVADEYDFNIETGDYNWHNPLYHGNFTGWRQLRKYVEYNHRYPINENEERMFA